MKLLDTLFNVQSRLEARRSTVYSINNMTTAETIKIDKLWEFQLYEQGKVGGPRPVGEPKRDIQPKLMFTSRDHKLERNRLYAVKRREVTLDDDGRPTYGEWDWATEWKAAEFKRRRAAIGFRKPRWLRRLTASFGRGA